MKKVRTIVRFRERTNYAIVHEVDSVFECTEERAAELIKLGFVVPLEKKKDSAAGKEKKVDNGETPTEKDEKGGTSTEEKVENPIENKDGEGENHTEGNSDKDEKKSKSKKDPFGGADNFQIGK